MKPFGVSDEVREMGLLGRGLYYKEGEKKNNKTEGKKNEGTKMKRKSEKTMVKKQGQSRTKVRMVKGEGGHSS